MGSIHIIGHGSDIVSITVIYRSYSTQLLCCMEFVFTERTLHAFTQTDAYVWKNYVEFWWVGVSEYCTSDRSNAKFQIIWLICYLSLAVWSHTLVMFRPGGSFCIAINVNISHNSMLTCYVLTPLLWWRYTFIFAQEVRTKAYTSLQIEVVLRNSQCCRNIGNV